jgi:hypothetical protein
MKKIIKLTESDLERLVRRIIKEEKRTSLIEGVETDVDGITDNLLKMYKDGINSGVDLNEVDSKVYDLLKKTISGHGADNETKKDIYNTLGNKLKGSKIPELVSFGQAYSSMASNM